MKKLVFEAKIKLAASRHQVFAWHEAPSAFERLAPPWVNMECVERSGGIQDGSRVVLVIHQGPVGIPWVLGHKDYIKDEQFCDYQIAGPFAYWQQLHAVKDVVDSDGHIVGAELVDHVEFLPPLGLLGRIGGALYIKSELARLFRYRHALMRRDLELQERYGKRPLKILVTGATGLVGSAFVPFMRSQGHTVLTMSRPQSGTAQSDGTGELKWDPEAGTIAQELPGDLDAIVHLGGHNVANQRWTVSEKQAIYESRIKSTTYLAQLIKAMPKPPATVVFASAVGYYGNRGVEPLTEDSNAGEGFLADVCRDWEGSAEILKDSPVRVSFARIGAVLTPKGGALAKMLPIFGAGGGGVVGSGKQYFPWVAMEDVIGSLYHAIVEESVIGPFNVVAPQCVTNAEFTHAFARVLQRPAIAPVKPVMLRALYGEMADALMLASVRVLPQKLKQTGYQFAYGELAPALKHMLGKG
ncbi:MAG: TIGR01777 family protein [Candidatus Obscuribacter sp.]|nr:TIGR01777 family protein [Candidatus Obscuribacter sp.]